ncbi:calcium-binding and coiled-coil domain-containing protein 2 isoform X2 [Tachyglossus aculeatus]|uniref:calcium-binding and coiled-coil domain-containing protein 2 isoform X2 n=1 Tax=Tachyglossus aculeatus TaxID=9261 RepID=UPI0018F41E86|nr:calcium-binding and coiled-coil domain-containing protein 2 isoform X2 [Tachyglossus aculeatus]
MEGAEKEPPTSAVLLDSCHFSQIIFNNVEKFYIPGGDVTCRYILTPSMVPRQKDWVGIFRVGWKTVREYYTFMWASLPRDLHSESARQQEVKFKAYYLPKDDEDYQFCYVDQDGVVRGASVPFQFRFESEDGILVVSTQGEVEEIEQRNQKLQEENQELRDNCGNLLEQKEELHKQLQRAQEKVKELEGEIDSLKIGNSELQRAQETQNWEMMSAQEGLVSVQEQTEKLEKENQELKGQLESLVVIRKTLKQQVSYLKEENKQLEEDKAHEDEERQRIRDQAWQLLAEKKQLEVKLKSSLDQLDQLQSRFSIQEKEIEKMSQEAQDKTRNLEQVRKENEQLLLRLAKQKEEQDRHVEELKQETLLTTQQHVQQISDLTQRLAESQQACRQLQREKENAEGENELLQAENRRLLSYANRDPGSYPFDDPVQAQGPPWMDPEPGFVFSNPYSAPQDFATNDPPSMKTCPVCCDVFPAGIYEEHVRSHTLDCPICDKSFLDTNRQVFDDHVFCHSL